MHWSGGGESNQLKGSAAVTRFTESLNLQSTENEDVALSAFDDKSEKPVTEDLVRMLGRTGTHWDDFRTHIAAEYAPLDETWTFAGAKWGWSLRLRQKKRTVVTMIPCKGHFLLGFALGEKAVTAAHDSRLPDSVLAVIDEAEQYPEGRAVRIEVRNKKDRESAKKLASIKMEN
jgi:hypothetical protein